MSPMGQKQTLTRLLYMSALPPKADIAERDHDVRLVPKADVGNIGNHQLVPFMERVECRPK
jgi:hypothetical protein